MSNKELRVKALSKIKHDNFSGLSAAAYAIAALPLLLGDITGIKLADIAITFAAAFIAALFCAAGYVRVAMGRWRFTKGGFRDLACCFTEWNTFVRSALPCAVYAGMITVFRHVVMTGGWITAAIVGVCLIFVHLFVSYALYGCELCPEKGPIKAAMTGVATAVKGMGAILEMKIYVYWWIAGLIAIIMYCCISGKQPGFITALIVFLVVLIPRWMVGAYIALCEAGLARTLFKQE